MYKYTKEIRDFINEPRRQYVLLENRRLWSQLCTSLDVIEDADLAVESYVNGDFGNDVGGQYLKLYGLLQSLFVQQDAVRHLCESLGFPDNLKAYPELKEIRDVRNDSVGHPTKRRNGSSYHSISRTSIEKSGFQLVSQFDGRIKFRDVSVLDLIRTQRKYLREVLNQVVSKLRAEDEAHKEKFRMEKLESIFAGVHPYKIFEGVNNARYVELGAVHLGEAKKVLQNLKESLQKRNIEIDTYDSIKYLYERLEYPIKELEAYFASLVAQQEPKITNETAYIFTDFINNKWSELQQICREIDEEYSA
jgi:hypothetical protein